MNAKETKIQPFIEGTKQFVVPLFQRPYSWEKKHWEDLWGDLIELYEEEQPRNHFMGSVVTMPAVSVPEGVTKYVLIDGQQRITTTLILLALIRDVAKTLPGTLSVQIENLLLLNPYQEGNEQYKLLPTQIDRNSFTSIVKGENVTEETQITKAYRYFDKQLRSVAGLNLEKLRSIIVRNLVIVSIVLDTDDNPHLIFESLNAKGRALTQADLIRNYFFMRMHPAQQEAMYVKHWAPLQSRLTESLTECIRHYLMKDGSVVKQGEVFFTLKARADKKLQQEVLDYLVELVEFAGYYERFVNPEREPNHALRQRLERLNRIEITTAYPFLLNVYRDFDKSIITSEEAVEILDVLENFMIRRFVCGVPTNTLNKMFPLLYSQAKQHHRLVEGVCAILATKNYPKDVEFRESFALVKLYGGDRGAKGRLILDRLEDSFGHKELVRPDNITIEHIMPQTLTDWWKAHLGDDWEVTHDLLLNEIGNLTLTGYNPQLSNADYHKKCGILKSSHLELNKYFDNTCEWSEAAIRQRGENLAARALTIWSNLTSDQGEVNDTSTLENFSEGSNEGYDLSAVLEQLGGSSHPPTNLRPLLYKLNDGKIVMVKYSKLYHRRNHYWYGIRPLALEELAEANATHVIFVMGQYGLATVPLTVLQTYCHDTRVSYNPDGSVRHYHILISNESVPYLFWSLETPKYSLQDHFNPFGKH